MSLASKRKLIGITALTIGIFSFYLVYALSGMVNFVFEGRLLFTSVLWIWLILSLLSKLSMMANQLKWPIQTAAVIAYCFVFIVAMAEITPIPQGQSLVMTTTNYLMFVLMFGWPAIDMIDIYIRLELKRML